MHSDWQFREVGKDTWYAATIPGCVHTDLFNSNLIPDPFYRDNEQKQQWIGKTDWEYRTTFNLTEEDLAREKIEIVFEGLDTYANVFLNEAPLINVDNMFRTWRVSAKQLLKVGANNLRIRFRSPVNEILPRMEQLAYQLPAGNDQGEKTSPYTRKAPYQFGWDWGPRFVTSGVWRPVYLESWDEARLNDLHIQPGEINTAAAYLTADVEVVAATSVQATVIIENITGRNRVAKRNVTLAPGSNRLKVPFVISRPALWWPNGLGDQPLYTFRARLFRNGKLTDEIKTRTGLRSLKLRQDVDAAGKSFGFEINGVPVFAKGGNWIPADSFPSRITKERYRQLLDSIRRANMNMVRVWGGGIYESDHFYEFCDEMGLLVWQDFMFGCSMYPGDPEFLQNVRAEAIDNVTRLRNHPSIVIWVGNNEIETAWNHWGWKDQLPATVWDDYVKLFHGVLPEVCSALDPSRPYWPSSPSSNLEDNPDSQRMGDVHYWGVWHASLPFADYKKQFPRFMSEYGFQSFPSIETVNTYTLPTDHDIESPVMLAHQRHPRGNHLVREYMLREYPEPKDFDSFLFVSQVLQAEGIKIGAEHLRRIMPHNMGSLYWQLNDCWPVASWSSIDYTGRWKALQYYARRFYAELLVIPHESEGNIEFFVVSERSQPSAAQLSLSLIDFEGNRLWTLKKDISIAPFHSRSYLSVALNSILTGIDSRKVFLLSELLIDGKSVSHNEHFFHPYKDLVSARPAIEFDVRRRSAAAFTITLSTDKLARAVYLASPEYAGTFSDNFFNLIPGKNLEVEFRSGVKISENEFKRSLRIRSLADAF